MQARRAAISVICKAALPEVLKIALLMATATFDEDFQPRIVDGGLRQRTFDDLYVEGSQIAASAGDKDEPSDAIPIVRS